MQTCTNPEILAKRKAYYQEHREEILERQRRMYQQKKQRERDVEVLLQGQGGQ